MLVKILLDKNRDLMLIGSKVFFTCSCNQVSSAAYIRWALMDKFKKLSLFLLVPRTTFITPMSQGLL